MSKDFALRALGPGEVYVVLNEAQKKRWEEYRPDPMMHNSSVVTVIIEPANNTSLVLVFYAVGVFQRLVPRSYVQKYDVETGQLTPVWETIETGTRIL